MASHINAHTVACQNRSLKQLLCQQVGTRPDGRSDMRPARIITDYRLSQNKAFLLVKCRPI